MAGCIADCHLEPRIGIGIGPQVSNSIANAIATMRRQSRAAGIAPSKAISIAVGSPRITGFTIGDDFIATIRGVAIAAGIAMRLERPSIGVVAAVIVTDLFALYHTIATDRGNRAAVRGAVVAILGIAIIAGFPGLTGAIATARTGLVGRAADIVEDRRADALVGLRSPRCLPDRTGIPNRLGSQRRFRKEGALGLGTGGSLAAGWQYGGEECQAKTAV